MKQLKLQFEKESGYKIREIFGSFYIAFHHKNTILYYIRDNEWSAAGVNLDIDIHTKTKEEATTILGRHKKSLVGMWVKLSKEERGYLILIPLPPWSIFKQDNTGKYFALGKNGQWVRDDNESRMAYSDKEKALAAACEYYEKIK